jgi:hypothetical protein
MPPGGWVLQLVAMRVVLLMALLMALQMALQMALLVSTAPTIRPWRVWPMPPPRLLDRRWQ